MNVNVRGVFFLTQAAFMLRAGASAEDQRIINTGSVNAHSAWHGHLLVFVVQGGGARTHRHPTTRLASDHITVNAIAPGPFGSNMMAASTTQPRAAIASGVPMGRIGMPDDMAGGGLRSAAGAYVTGAVARRWWLVDHHRVARRGEQPLLGGPSSAEDCAPAQRPHGVHPTR